MDNFLNKLERKIGRYAIPNLTLILIALYAAGYFLQTRLPQVETYLTLDVYQIIHKCQIWRIFTWLLIPPGTMDFFTILMLLFYYSIGRSLENTWGVFRYNIYLVSGVLFTIIGAFALHGAAWLIFKDAIATYGAEAVFLGQNSVTGAVIPTELIYTGPIVWPYYISTYYINMSLFLAYAATYPEHQVYLMLFIPIKVKWLGVIYGVTMGYSFLLTNNLGARVTMVMSILNFLLLFFTSKTFFRMSPSQIKRRMEFKRSANAVNKREFNWNPHSSSKSTGADYNIQNRGGKTIITRHKCAICGRTELDGEDLEFRFCSKCNGNYEYCSEHLYTHNHVE